MNVYDFDNTIYDGESSFDFFIYCLKRKPSIARFLLPTIVTLIEYKLCIISTDGLTSKCEKYMDGFLSRLDSPEKTVKEFWDCHEHKIKAFYKKMQKPDDVIISASNDFFLEEICKRLGIKNLIASRVDLNKRKVVYLCHNEAKVRLFKERFPNDTVDNFYTDSMNDLPMIKLSEKAFIVHGDKIKEYK